VPWKRKKAISGSVVRGNKDGPWIPAEWLIWQRNYTQSSLAESVVITTAKRSERQNPSQTLKPFGHTKKLIGEKKSTYSGNIMPFQVFGVCTFDKNHLEYRRLSIWRY